MTSPFQRRRGAAKSHVVGPALQRDGSRTTAYRAAVALTCARCGAAIAVDALFSRHASPQRAPAPLHTFGPEVAPAPVCTGCCPLRCADDPAAEGGPHG